jgi:hypothetical protein
MLSATVTASNFTSVAMAELTVTASWVGTRCRHEWDLAG